jgi:exopolysaccharide biosynthesis WecB/TagA/CpsF family protein
VTTTRILNIDIHNHRFGDFLEQLTTGVVVTPNVDHLVKLQHDREFYECYRAAEHLVCDSRIVQLASRLLHPGRGIPEQIAGSDLLPAWCAHQGRVDGDQRLFLLGGSIQSVQRAAERLNELAGREIIAGEYSPPFGFEHDPVECERIVSRVIASGATALAVGVGAPKQEKWIYRHRHKLPNVKLFFAVGATIDFLAGEIKRAPRWMTRVGLEWFYRLLQEPGRLARRYLIEDLPFFWLILKQRLGLYRNPWENHE